MNLIRGTRSRGIEEYSVVGARVNRVRESTRATLHGAKEEKLARQGRATGWSLDMVCLHSATMRRSSVFHGNYRRAWSSMPFVYQLISLFRSTYFFFPSMYARVYQVSPHEIKTIEELIIRERSLAMTKKKNDLSSLYIEEYREELLLSSFIINILF